MTSVNHYNDPGWPERGNFSKDIAQRREVSFRGCEWETQEQNTSLMTWEHLKSTLVRGSAGCSYKEKFFQECYKML